MRAARTDTNQTAIVEALRAAGAFVQSLATVGDGCPDLLVAKGRKWLVMEIKHEGGKLRTKQQDWAAKCGAPVPIVRSPDEALAVLKYWTR